MTSKFIGRTGIERFPACSHCDNPCEHEQYEVTHSFKGKERVTKTYCSLECLREEMGIEEYVTQQVETRARQEYNWLHKQICPACRRRIIKAV